MEESRRGVKQQKSERKAEVQSRREKREASAIKLGTPHQRTPRHVTKARGLAGSRSARSTRGTSGPGTNQRKSCRLPAVQARSDPSQTPAGAKRDDRASMTQRGCQWPITRHDRRPRARVSTLSDTSVTLQLGPVDVRGNPGPRCGDVAKVQIAATCERVISAASTRYRRETETRTD